MVRCPWDSVIVSLSENMDQMELDPRGCDFVNLDPGEALSRLRLVVLAEVPRLWADRKDHKFIVLHENKIKVFWMQNQERMTVLEEDSE
jgi:hypothetical protein